MKGKSQPLGANYYSTKDVSCMFGVSPSRLAAKPPLRGRDETSSTSRRAGWTGESTMKRWVGLGKLKCSKALGGHRRYSRDRIQEFIDIYKYNVESTPAEISHWMEKMGGDMIDFLLLKEDYHTLREVCFADSLKADTESLTRVLINCSSIAEIPLTVVFNEIVLKTIEKIKNLGRQQKLNREQEEGAINAVLESFARLKRELRAATQG
ncbi:MAG: hypothetical protein ACE5H0_11995 [Bacteroidota bacterium]